MLSKCLYTYYLRFGIANRIILARFNKNILGYLNMVYAIKFIKVLDFGLQNYHIYSRCLDAHITAYYIAAIFIIAILTYSKLFSSLAICYKESVKLIKSRYFALWFVYIFNAMGLCRVFLANPSVDIIFHNIYYDIPHF